MRDQTEIIEEYNATRIKAMQSKLPWRHPEYIKMQKHMHALRDEYVNTLEPDKKLAVELHNSLCRTQPAWQCSFQKEINGVVDDWDGRSHQLWLQKAHDALEVVEDIQNAIDALPSETLHNLLEVLTKEERLRE